jgi:elongation factor Ts
MITTEQIKQLRDATGISIMQCRKALEESAGDMEKALAILKKKGADAASKKSDRTLAAGRIASYVHSNALAGAMVELASETDFVSKNEDFYALARDIAMHVVASKPAFLKTSDISEEEKARMMDIFKDEAKDKPANIQEKIIAGKLEAYLKDRALLEQPFIKNPDMTIKNLLEEAIQKFGEKVEIVRFVRYGVMEA